jgi:hypothetical protein
MEAAPGNRTERQLFVIRDAQREPSRPWKTGGVDASAIGLTRSASRLASILSGSLQCIRPEPTSPEREEPDMSRTFLVPLLAAIWLNLPAVAAEDRAVAALTQDLRQHAPSQWEVRVRWRDGYLLATITPQPTQTAFELVYAPAKMTETLIDLCPGVGAEIWSLIGLDQDVVLEPSVGGKAVVTARISCRKAKLDRS